MNDPSKSVSPEHIWEAGWEGHERSQRQRLAKLPFAEKLAWLEESQKLISHLKLGSRHANDAASAGK